MHDPQHTLRPLLTANDAVILRAARTILNNLADAAYKADLGQDLDSDQCMNHGRVCASADIAADAIVRAISAVEFATKEDHS